MDYQAVDLQESSSGKIDQILKNIHRTHDVSEYLKKKFIDDVLGSIQKSEWRRKFVEEFFLWQFKGIDTQNDAKGCLHILYKPLSKYLAKAALGTGNYDFIMGFVSGTFGKAEANAKILEKNSATGD
ncbi:hypothetical protein [Domibacillus mangrovi]|nr:hypothetical protein [Domibacillus mangrovi]